jgi:hypothetical protein
MLAYLSLQAVTASACSSLATNCVPTDMLVLEPALSAMYGIQNVASVYRPVVH